jgi:hypothetical protein
MDDSIMEQDSESKSYLRRAGQYQDDEIENLIFDKGGPYITVILSFITVIVYVWLIRFFPSFRNPYLVTIVFFLPIPFFMWKIVKLRKQIIKYRRGSLGEKVVADELEKIKRYGYMVIHDFQHKAVGNIDHIAIGSRGVFAIETKYRSKKNEEDSIFYDGIDVYVQNSSGYKMPIDNDKGKKPCSQAIGAAVELQKMLQKNFPMVAYVQAVVVFPFWKVAMQYSNTPTARVSDAKELYKQIQARDDNFSDETVMAIYDFLAKRNRRNHIT